MVISYKNAGFGACLSHSLADLTDQESAADTARTAQRPGDADLSFIGREGRRTRGDEITQHVHITRLYNSVVIGSRALSAFLSSPFCRAVIVFCACGRATAKKEKVKFVCGPKRRSV